MNQEGVCAGFCGNILQNKSVNVFERMEITEYIYEVVVEPYYKKYTRADANPNGHRWIMI